MYGDDTIVEQRLVLRPDQRAGTSLYWLRQMREESLGNALTPGRVGRLNAAL
jgi:hypothetical protein